MDLSNGESSESSPTMKNVFPPVAQALDLFDGGSLLNSDMYQQYLKSWNFLMVHSVIHSTKINVTATFLKQQNYGTISCWTFFVKIG